MTSRDRSLWEDLVVAVLAVNRYSLEKTYSRVEEMRREGLFEPENLMRWTPNEIVLRLKSARYDRGQFMTYLFAVRLSSLGQYLESVGIDYCQEVLMNRGAHEIKNFLLPVRGIGPRVLANFFLLRGTDSSDSKTKP